VPTLEQATQAEREGLKPVVGLPMTAPVAGYAQQQYPPNPNPFLRCPLPPISASPDSLRQYYQGGQVPQSRIMTSPSVSQAGGGGSGGGSTTINNTTQNTIKQTTITTMIGTMQSASVTTPSLVPGQSYQTIIGTSRGFVPLIVAVSGAARVQLYATKIYQSIDIGRPATQPPNAGTEQGILLDVSIDSAPFSWLVTPAIPSLNADSPQVPQSYLTVTNLSLAVVPITVSVQYLTLEI
jgi:hypothetical protein